MKNLVFTLLSVGLLSCLTTNPSANTLSGTVFFHRNYAELQALFPSDLPSEDGLQIYLREGVYEYQTDGSLKLRSRWTYKITENQALEGWSQVTANWSPWNMSRPEIQVRVTNPNGQQFWLDQNHIVEGAPKQGENGILSNNKILTAPFPQIGLGSIVEEEVVYHFQPYVQGAGIRKTFDFSFGRPIKVYRASVSVPEGMPFHYLTPLMDTPPEVVQGQGQQTYIFDQSDHPGHDGYESMVDKHSSYYAYLEFSNAQDWASLAEKYAARVEPLFDPLSEPYPELDWSDLDASLRQTLYWLDEEVRYVGLELGENSIIPFSPAESLSRGFGDCKDKATILISILREQGLPAYMALLKISTNQDVNPAVPGLESFDHAIVYLDTEPPIWIDPTTDLNRTAALPAWDRDRNALIIRPGQNSLVRTTPAQPGDNTFEEVRRFTLSPNGHSDMRTTYSATGMYEIFMRRRLQENPEAYKENLLKHLKNKNKYEEILEFDYLDPKDFTQGAQVSFDFQGVESGRTDIHEAVVLLENWDTALELPKPFYNFDLESRVHPYEAERAKEVRMRYEIVPPRGFVLTEPIPEDIFWDLGPFHFERTLEETPEGEIHVQYYSRINSGVFSPEVFMDTIGALKELTDGFSEIELVRFRHKYLDLTEEGRHPEAFALLKELTESEEANSSDYHRLSLALLEMGMRNEAAKAAKLALE
jgi:hypothetical protein